MKLNSYDRDACGSIFVVTIGVVVGTILGGILFLDGKPSCKVIASGAYAKADYLRGSGCSSKDETIITWQDGSTTVLSGVVPVDMKVGETYSIVRYNNKNPKFELSEKACILDLRTK